MCLCLFNCVAFPYLLLLIIFIIILIYLLYIGSIVIVGTWVFDCKPCGKDSTPESRVKKHKIGRWLSSTDSRGEYFVRVGTRTSLRVDPFANIVARGVYLVSVDVSKGSMTLRTF